VRLPMVVLSALMRARAIAAGRDHRTARARVRSSESDRWLVCHASYLRDEDGEIGDTALVIETATSSEIAPIITEAYELSPREREITELIARGIGTGDIATALHLSTHTVRDYVKAVFDRLGVSSRGELVAKLFAEHHAPLHLDERAVDRLDDGAFQAGLR
jgi:DNA-binding NarL/FixJ family response regulator